MGSSKHYGGFWIGLAVALSALFAVLFYPAARRTYNPGTSLVFTALGVIVIWIVYFIRVMIFSRLDKSCGQKHGGA